MLGKPRQKSPSNFVQLFLNPTEIAAEIHNASLLTLATVRRGVSYNAKQVVHQENVTSHRSQVSTDKHAGKFSSGACESAGEPFNETDQLTPRQQVQSGRPIIINSLPIADSGVCHECAAFFPRACPQVSVKTALARLRRVAHALRLSFEQSRYLGKDITSDRIASALRVANARGLPNMPA